MTRGTKRKIQIEKRETTQQRSVACSKRRKTVFSKAADICFLSGANIAVLVTSPDDNSDVVYSFSAYSSPSEIFDSYLKGKIPPKITTNPQSKLRLFWQDTHLYRDCDDLSQINLIEDQLLRVKKDIMGRLEKNKKEKLQLVSVFDQNPTTSSSFDQTPYTLSPSSSKIASFDQNSYSDEIYGESCPPSFCFDQNPYSDQVQFVPDFDQNPTISCSFGQNLSTLSPSSSKIVSFDQNFYSEEIYGEPCPQSFCFDQETTTTCSFDQSPSSSKIASFDQNSYSDEIYGEPCPQSFCFDQNPYSLDEIYGEPCPQSFCFDQNPSAVSPSSNQPCCLWEAEEQNNSLGLVQETQTEPLFNVVGYDQDQSFWGNLLTTPTDDYMIGIGEFLNEEEIGLLHFS